MSPNVLPFGVGGKKIIADILWNETKVLFLTQNRDNMRKPMHQHATQHIFANAKRLREQRTPAEIVLWEALRNKKLEGFRFRQQHPIEDYVLDFYCHSVHLAIELDGEYHFTDEQAKLDDYRTARLSALGIKIIRFSNHQVLHHLEAVLSEIRQALVECY
jgi:very-short-patch-repair endonuclease